MEQGSTKCQKRFLIKCAFHNRTLSYKKQELYTPHDHPSSASVCWWDPCCSSCYQLFYYVSLRSYFTFHVEMYVTYVSLRSYFTFVIRCPLLMCHYVLILHSMLRCPLLMCQYVFILHSVLRCRYICVITFLFYIPC